LQLFDIIALKEHDHLIHNDTFTKYSAFPQHVNDNQTPHILANSIDAQINKSLLLGEKKIALPPYPPWSEKLHNTSLQPSPTLKNSDIDPQLVANAAADAQFFGPIPT
jgi:hypothetical protein